MNRILVMHGVNLNLFGKRDPKHYGTETLEDINGKLSALAGELGVEVSFFQSNYEGAFVERIQEAHGDGTAGIVLNAGAWTHYSYAIMDALAILSIPAVEVHMSNVHARDVYKRQVYGLMAQASNQVMAEYLRSTRTLLSQMAGYTPEQIESFIDDTFSSYIRLMAQNQQKQCPSLFYQRLVGEGALETLPKERVAFLSGMMAITMCCLLYTSRCV